MSTPLAKLAAANSLQLTNWPAQFAQQCKASRIKRSALPTALQQLVTAAIDRHRQDGLDLPDDSAYLSTLDNAQFCFFPMIQRHALAGMTEYRVPVFFSKDGTDWHQSATLNGFNLEALCRSGLSAEALLPTGITQLHKEIVFSTLQGSVLAKTQLSDNTAQTKIQVHQGKSLIFEAQFISKHSLNTTPG
jgi:hypothetical protein